MTAYGNKLIGIYDGLRSDGYWRFIKGVALGGLELL
jgi:hypothetical protein